MHWARQSLKTLPDEVRAPARLALMLLSDYADERHVSWPSINTMALEMGCSVRSVQRAIDLLESHGLVRIEQRHATNGRQLSNLYHLAVGVGCQPVTPSISDHPGEGDSLTGRGDNLTPPEGDNLTGEGDTGDRGRVSPVSPLESTNRPYQENLSHSAGEDEAPVAPESAPDPALDPGPPSGDVFDRAQGLDDSGRPLGDPEAPPPALGGHRQFVMHLDWQPSPEQLAAACLRRALPMDTWPSAEALANFTAHFAEQPYQHRTEQGWHERLAQWLADDRRRQPRHATAGGDHAHAHRSQRTPARRLSAREARERDRQAREQHAGAVYDHEA